MVGHKELLLYEILTLIFFHLIINYMHEDSLNIFIQTQNYLCIYVFLKSCKQLKDYLLNNESNSWHVLPLDRTTCLTYCAIIFFGFVK